MPLGAYRINSIARRQAAAGPVSLDAVQFVQADAERYRSTSLTTNIIDKKVLTGSAWINIQSTTNRKTIYNLRTSNRAPFLWVINTNRTMRILCVRQSDSQNAINATTTTGVIANNDEWYHVAFSFDLTDTNKRAMYVNGVSTGVTWSTYSNINWEFDIATRAGVACNAEQGATEADCKISQIWVDDSYIDLSTNINKFYDNGPVDLGSDGTGTGLSQPLIYHYGNTTSSPTFAVNLGRTAELSYTMTANGTPSDTTGPST